MENSDYGYTKLYHPRGPLVSLPVPAADPVVAFEYVGKCLDAGWLVQAPGLEEGEHKEGVGYVLRGLHERDGESTPFLLLYDTNEGHTFSFLKVYLNNLEDIRNFEAASGLSLNGLPEYSGNDKPERGKSARIDQFIVKPPRTLVTIMKNNPRYNEEDKKAALAKNDVYKVPRRLFVRWDGLAPTKPADQAGSDQPAPAAPPPAAPPTKTGTGAPTGHQPSNQVAWTKEQAIKNCQAAGVTIEHLKAEIKKRRPSSEGWNMLLDTPVAMELIEAAKQPLAPSPGYDPDEIPF